MAVIGPTTSPGVQGTGDIAGHVARSSLRRLVAGLFDAWDDGDCAGVGSMFARAGRWTDSSGTTVGPPGAVAAAVAAWRAWEPWSIHWLSNEQITTDDTEKCLGSWLWSAASTIDGGRTPAWSGGDLTVVAAWSDGRWAIEELTMTDRYRTPYDKGWLAESMTPAPAPGTPVANGGPFDGGPREMPVAPPTTLEDLSSEVELRTLMGEFIDDLEEARGARAVASRWTSDGLLALTGMRRAETAAGTDQITALIDREHGDVQAVMRVLFSESISAIGGRGRCCWRDLWTGVRDGTAVWMSHRYVVDAVRVAGDWRFERMEQRRVLDCPYAEGWPTTVDRTKEGSHS